MVLWLTLVVINQSTVAEPYQLGLGKTVQAVALMVRWCRLDIRLTPSC